MVFDTLQQELYILCLCFTNIFTFTFYECNPIDFDAYFNVWWFGSSIESWRFGITSRSFHYSCQFQILMFFSWIKFKPFFFRLLWNTNFKWKIFWFVWNADKMLQNEAKKERKMEWEHTARKIDLNNLNRNGS